MMRYASRKFMLSLFTLISASVLVFTGRIADVRLFCGGHRYGTARTSQATWHRRQRRSDNEPDHP